MPSPTHEIVFAGERLVLDGEGVLFWPRLGVLVASDLHFEKSTYFAQQGALLAPYDTLDTLERLEAVMRRYRPKRLLLLGDSFHDSGAWARMEDPLRQRMQAVCGLASHCHWIEGNHDRSLAAQAFGFEATREMEGILFSHEREESPLPQIIGHFHPKVRVALGKRGVRGACFAVTERMIVMPAFGSYTGGLDVRHDAFQALLAGQAMKPYLLYRKKVYPLAVMPSGLG